MLVSSLEPGLPFRSSAYVASGSSVKCLPRWGCRYDEGEITWSRKRQSSLKAAPVVSLAQEQHENVVSSLSRLSGWKRALPKALPAPAFPAARPLSCSLVVRMPSPRRGGTGAALSFAPGRAAGRPLPPPAACSSALRAGSAAGCTCILCPTGSQHPVQSASSSRPARPETAHPAWG